MHSQSKTVSEIAFQQCISPSCRAMYGVEQVLTACTKCGGLLDVSYDWDAATIPDSLSEFESKWSQRHDPSTGRIYWFNVQTRLASWTNPREATQTSIVSSASASGSAVGGGAVARVRLRARARALAPNTPFPQACNTLRHGIFGQNFNMSRPLHPSLAVSQARQAAQGL